MNSIKDRMKSIVKSILEIDDIMKRHRIYQILVALFITISYFLSFSSFFTNHLYHNFDKDSSYLFANSHINYDMRFEAVGHSLNSLRVYYDQNKSNIKTTDRMNVILSDSYGNTLATDNTYLYGYGRNYIRVDLSDAVLTKGDTYYLHFTFDDMANDSLLVIYAHQTSDFSGISVPSDNFTDSNSNVIVENQIVSDNSVGYERVANIGYLYSSISVVWLIIHTVIYLLIIALLFSRRLLKSVKFKESYRAIVLPLVLYIASEVLNVEKEYSFSFLYPLTLKHYYCLFLTLLLFVLLYYFFYLLTGTGTGGFVILSIIVAVLSFVNHTKLVMRGDTLMPWDVAAAGIAMKTGSTYYFSITSRFICGILLFLVLFIMMRLTNTKVYKWNKRRVVLALTNLALLVAVFNVFILNTKLLDKLKIYYQVYPPFQSYNENGTTLAFLFHLNNVFDSSSEVNDSSDLQALISEYSDITDDDMYTSRVNNNGIRPNVICIMSEAYSDLQSIRDFNTSEIVNPFYTELMNDSINGNIAVSIFGGGTCNTEFEFLTGYSMNSLMPGASVYSFYVNNDIDALPRIYAENGYRTVAVHPFDGNWWDRNSRYPYLGFNEFYTQNDFGSDSQYVRRYISDLSCFQKITSIYETSEEPLFLFCVTMQNHADFADHYDNMHYDIHINDFDNGVTNDYYYAENYLSLIRESDDALQYLINYLEDSDEPTIVVYFGDHCPSLNDGFYNELLQTDVGTASLLESLQIYQTPYFIWANYDLCSDDYNPPFTNDMEITSPNFLGQTLLDLTGIESPESRSSLRVLQTRISAISAAAIYDLNGNPYINEEEIPDDIYEIIDDYLTIQYGLINLDED